ncbi:acyl-CoA carboxylase epsilon subunit [Streptomyces sp. HPF1205]|uniref:acyl-CoA carboxylase epsilon subunit n=1 Tax=Streptomyces sp. HPF1205 TaxID=2873262 RepID=UPI0021F1D165|nr:acyl-CoA carboxylase epsilon subunit [Streptomyces sp. HPF1205]
MPATTAVAPAPATPAAPPPAPGAGPRPVRLAPAAIPAQGSPPANGFPAAAAKAPVAAEPPEAPLVVPLLRVVRGSASADEIAAVTAVLLARAAAVRGAAGTGEALTSRRAAARWRVTGFSGARAWNADARDLLAG